VSMASAKMQTIGLNAWYGRKQVLYDLTLDIPEAAVTAIIGPSGCGKSTFLRCLNRLHEEQPRARVSGTILLDGEDLGAKDVVSVRFRVGMVFQKPSPFPNMSIFENVAAGLRLLGVHRHDELDEGVVDALQHAGLWEEVEEILDAPGTSLSGGQQQRLCIARALAVRPEVLLLDEPCSALDPIATAKIESLLAKLRSEYSVVIVTHNLAQAVRVADYTAFLYLGKLVEFGPTDQVFQHPVEKLTENYVTGRFG
jgi:phosphate transport system ATP-binding protein